ncbi:MAG: hypothetical protein ACFBSE_11190 [Prochloraceae cyanobacterium]
MFILTEQDIEYCQVSNSESPLEGVYPGIVYRGILFCKVGSYQKSQFQMAIDSCRKFLEREKPVTSIIVKSTEYLTLWREKEGLHVTLTQSHLKRQLQHQTTAISEALEDEEVTVIKYRGREIIKQPVKHKIDPQKILNRKKKTLKYRGLKY